MQREAQELRKKSWALDGNQATEFLYPICMLYHWAYLKSMVLIRQGRSLYNEFITQWIHYKMGYDTQTVSHSHFNVRAYVLSMHYLFFYLNDLY